jgi:hypothetical protein
MGVVADGAADLGVGVEGFAGEAVEVGTIGGVTFLLSFVLFIFSW